MVRSLATTADCLRARGHEVDLIEPGRFRTIPCPTYPEIRLALGCAGAVRRQLDALAPDAVHIATEGPIGWAVRAWCRQRNRPFTTAFHTRFPDYLALRTRLPADWFWSLLRRFHAPAERTFAVTRALAEELESRGIGPVHRWPLGVDLGQFHPAVPPHPAISGLPGPVMLNVGRVAVEKNIRAFLDCPFPGSKVIVGDGPELPALRKLYPEVHFMGTMHGQILASAYTAADVFVFPSRTDTFGLVNIEALACGVPIAAYPVRGPLEIIGATGRGMHTGQRRLGAVDDDLARAIQRALTGDRVAAADEARHYGWESCTDFFLDGLATDFSAKHELPARTTWSNLARAP